MSVTIGGETNKAVLYTNKNILIDKIINRILTKKNVVWSRISPSKVSQKLFGKKSITNLRLKDILNNCIGDVSKIDLNCVSPEEKESILFYANQTLNHKFDYLGSGWTQIEPIDWHTDFINGHKWNPGRFYKDYIRSDHEGGFDIKVVWELSRCHHLLWLAEAYSLTKNNVYSKEIINQISDWIDNNPLMYSVNWTCSMDVAIRAINWIYALGIIIESGSIETEFSYKVYKSLFEHVFFIVNNLERTHPYSGNHYLSDITGLLFICGLFPDNFFARIWFRFALKEFHREALIEISNDGSNYEYSISYHRLVSELFVWSYSLLLRLNYQIPKEIESRFLKMIDYIASYTKRSGLSPLIGDNDNGRLLPFTPRDFREHGYMVNIGNVLWGNRYEEYNGVSAESLYISCGLKNIFNVEESFSVKDCSIFPDSKLAILRNNETELFVTNSSFSLKRCEAQGLSGGTHTHPDALSFDLSFANEDFIIDPGTYVYTSNPLLRNLFRATISHNTIEIDGLNQTDFSNNNVFVQTNYLTGHVLTVTENRDKKGVTGSYNFNDGKTSFNHSRSFEVENGTVIINDIVNCDGDHNLTLNYHVAPEIVIEVTERRILLNSKTGTVEIDVIADEDVLNPKVIDSLFSPSYGILQKSKSVRYSIRFSDKIEILTKIRWRKK